MSEPEVKKDVRQFYDRIGWQLEEDGFYQNARYEDLRPVSREYIHRCHLRVNRHLKPNGRFLLDAGSGPVQYPEYLTYSAGYQYRVCLDLSIVALMEARKRLGEKGLYVVADVSNLPFKSDAFDGLVSLHTIHHVPAQDKQRAYEELYRVLVPNSNGVIVNGWTHSPLMDRSRWLVSLMERIGGRIARRRGIMLEKSSAEVRKDTPAANPTGTFIQKQDADWLRQQLAGKMEYQVFVWRSVNVRFLRAVIHSKLGGKFWLRVLYRLEEWFPRYFGENGQYPLVVIRKG